MQYHYSRSKSIKTELLTRRIELLSKNYKQAWVPIFGGFIDLINQLPGDTSYSQASALVKHYSRVPTIRQKLMQVVNQAYEVGL